MDCYSANGDSVRAVLYCDDIKRDKRVQLINEIVGVRGETQLTYYCTKQVDNKQQCVIDKNSDAAKSIGLDENNMMTYDKLPSLPNYNVTYCPIRSQQMLTGLCSDHKNEYIVDYDDLSNAVINVVKRIKKSTKSK